MGAMRLFCQITLDTRYYEDDADGVENDKEYKLAAG